VCVCVEKKNEKMQRNWVSNVYNKEEERKNVAFTSFFLL